MDQKYLEEAANEYNNFVDENPHDWGRWGFTFLHADSRLGEEERLYLFMKATSMYLRNETTKTIKTDSLEGKLVTQGKHDSLGCFGGQRFDAQLDTANGKVKVRFLVSEQTGAHHYSSLPN